MDVGMSAFENLTVQCSCTGLSTVTILKLMLVWEGSVQCWLKWVMMSRSYTSRSLLKHEHNYAITELETLALVWSMKHFLLGHKCVVYTDHAACTLLLNTPHPSAKLACWVMIMQEMNLEIKGKGNTNADVLSHNPVDDAWVVWLETSDSPCDFPKKDEIITKTQIFK